MAEIRNVMDHIKWVGRNTQCQYVTVCSVTLRRSVLQREASE